MTVRISSCYCCFLSIITLKVLQWVASRDRLMPMWQPAKVSVHLYTLFILFAE